MDTKSTIALKALLYTLVYTTSVLRESESGEAGESTNFGDRP